MRRALLLLALVTVGCSGSSTAPSPVTPAPSVPPVVTPAPVQPVRDPARFDQTFWNEFVHNGYDAPPGTAPLQRLTAAPMIYLRTVDDAGLPIDALTLQTVEDALRSVAAIWGGGTLGLAGIQRGTSTMQGQHGWLTVAWPNPSIGAVCGTSSVGADGGLMRLNYLRAEGCGCNGSKMRPRTIRHELGHAFGYWHTDSDGDLMRNGVNGCADSFPSAREVYHSEVAYRSPIGTTTALPAGHVVAID